MTTNSRDARNRRRGYLEGMKDIADQLELHGVEGVIEWLKNNYYDTLSREEIAQRTARLSYNKAFPKLEVWVEEKALARKEATEAGTQIHQAIEDAFRDGIEEAAKGAPERVAKMKEDIQRAKKGGKVKKGPVSGKMDISPEKVAEWQAFCQSLPKGTVLPTLKDFVSGDFQKKLSQ